MMLFLELNDDEVDLIKNGFPKLFKVIKPVLSNDNKIEVNTSEQYKRLDEEFAKNLYSKTTDESSHEWTDDEFWLEEICMRIPSEYQDD